MKTRLPHMRTILLSIFCLTLFVFSATAQQLSKKISLQGFLKDANGKAVTDNKTQSITFKLYSQATGGTAEWTEDQTVDVFGGVYSTQLGKTVSLESLNWGAKTYFVGVNVQGVELTPRTELTFAPYSLGSPSAQTVVCSGAVGDVKHSILNPTQFAAVNGDCWVPMDGRNIAGSKLATILSVTNLPNGGGMFLRAQDFSNSDADPERNSTSPIATLQEQSMQTHYHGFSGSTNSNTSTPYGNITYLHGIWTGDGAFRASGTLPESFEEGQGKPDRFFYVNTIDLSGNHAHSFSGNTGNNSGYSTVETRPKNLNFWIYIRIN